MAGERRGDDVTGGGRGAVGGAPLVVKVSCLDDEPRRAVAALQRVLRHEGALDGVQVGVDRLEVLDGLDPSPLQ
jgi:hypothetical protein